MRAVLALVALMLALPLPALADPPQLSPEQFLPGDAAPMTPVEEQDLARVAAGGPGYLVVWEDQRTILTGQPHMEGPLVGNGLDIYGRRLDHDGNPLDPAPFVICNAGRNQYGAQVAWNEAAQQWLVVFTSERPDWYFFRDIVGVRVGADGTVLDPTPIPLRPETNNPSNDYAEAPAVESDGQVWLAIWQDTRWQGNTGYPTIAGKRVAADGTMLDPAPVVLYQNPHTSFGPILPHIAWATDEWLLVWEQAGYNDVMGRRLSGALQPLDANPLTITTNGNKPRVATDGTDFLVIQRWNKVHRVTHGGAVLDPSGIELPSPNHTTGRAPDVAWDGSSWVTVNSGPRNGRSAVFANRVDRGGVVLPPGSILVHDSAYDQYSPSLASGPQGKIQVVCSGRDIAQQQMLENIESMQLRPDNSTGPLRQVSAGLPRHESPRWTTAGDVHVVAFASRGGGLTRVMAQRVDLAGQPIDLEPVEVGSLLEGYQVQPDVAWNGLHYLVVWTHQGSVYGRRLDGNLAPVEPQPVVLITDASSQAGLGSIGADFYLAYAHTFSVDQRILKGFLVDGDDLSQATAPAVLGVSYVAWYPRVKPLGDRYLVVWQKQARHDISTSITVGRFVSAGGTAEGDQFTINGNASDSREPDLAVAPDRALIAYADDDQGANGRVAGRLLNLDGTFHGEEFVIADAPGWQRFTACGFDGERFIVAWTDFRDVDGVEQLRGDIFAARVSLDGVSEDPSGFAVTGGSLPEDLPQVIGAGGTTLVSYLRLNGTLDPEVQRVAFVAVGGDATVSVEPGGPSATPSAARWALGPNPFRDGLQVEFRGEEIGRRGPVDIGIFTVDGRSVARGVVAAGSTSWRWDGRGRDGAPVSAGVYLVRMSEAGGAEKTGSVTKLR